MVMVMVMCTKPYFCPSVKICREMKLSSPADNNPRNECEKLYDMYVTNWI